MQAALQKGYTVAARSDMDQILRELRLQQTNITEEALAQVGKALNVSAVLLVTVTDMASERYTPLLAQQGVQYYRGKAHMSARLVGAEAAQVVWVGDFGGSANISNQTRIEEVLPFIARVLASGLPVRR
jgi:hypothetical protein